MEARSLKTSSADALRGAEIGRARWLMFAHRDAPRGRVVVLDGIPYRSKGDGGWERKRDDARAPDPRARNVDMKAANHFSSVAKKKRDAAPSWQDLIDVFGEGGAVRNADGKVVGYRYPKYDDPERSQQVANKVYELWDPHRRVSVRAGAELNADIKLATIENRDTGQVRQVDERSVDKVAPEQGFTVKKINAR